MNLFLVTGASSGLGLALVHQLCRARDTEVVAISRRPVEIPGVRHVAIDLSGPEGIRAGMEEALEGDARFKTAVLINNAGVVDPVAPLVRADPAELDLNIRTNLVGPMLTMQAFLDIMGPRAERRVVVNISSGAGRRPVSGWSAYCASKAGLDMATRVAALESPPGVLICSLAPGVVDTPMQAGIRDARQEDFPDLSRFQAMMAEGTLRPAEDVARDILGHLVQGRLKHGALHDLRDMAA